MNRDSFRDGTTILIHTGFTLVMVFLSVGGMGLALNIETAQKLFIVQFAIAIPIVVLLFLLNSLVFTAASLISPTRTKRIPIMAALHLATFLVLGAIVWMNMLFYAVCLTDEGQIMMKTWLIILLSGGVITLPRLRNKAPSIYWRGSVVAILVVAGITSLFFSWEIVHARLEKKAITAERQLPVADSASPLVVIGIDALEYDLVKGLSDAGYLPFFSDLLKQSTAGPLTTHVPTSSPVIWTTLATGMTPSRHGIRDFVTYRNELGNAGIDLLPRYLMVGKAFALCGIQPRPVSSQQRSEQTFWEILQNSYYPVGIVNWWATIPVSAVRGFCIGNCLYGHKNLTMDMIRRNEEHWLYPSNGSLLPAIEQALKQAEEERPVMMGELFGHDEIRLDQLSERDRYRRTVVEKIGLTADLFVYHVSRELYQTWHPRLFVMYFNGLDITKHLYYQSGPENEKIRISVDGNDQLVSPIVFRYYVLLDKLLSQFSAELQPETTLVILSDHGMDPLSSIRKLHYDLIRNMHWLEGFHDNAPPGFYLFKGQNIRRNVTMTSPRVYDIAPTILRLAEYPYSEAMPGHTIEGILTEDFISHQPPRRISNYGPPAVISDKQSDNPERPEMMELLKSLGYIN